VRHRASDAPQKCRDHPRHTGGLGKTWGARARSPLGRALSGPRRIRVDDAAPTDHLPSGQMLHVLDAHRTRVPRALRARRDGGPQDARPETIAPLRPTRIVGMNARCSGLAVARRLPRGLPDRTENASVPGDRHRRSVPCHRGTPSGGVDRFRHDDFPHRIDANGHRSNGSRSALTHPPCRILPELRTTRP